MKVVIAANTSWYVHNFRGELMRELKSRNADIVVLAPHDEWSSRFKDIGVRYVETPMSRKGTNPFIDLRLLGRFYRVYAQERPDVVFHNTIKPVIFGSIAARWARVNLILNMIPGLGYVFIGEDLPQRALQPFVRRLYKYALKNSRKVFFQNPDDKKYFVEHRLIEEEKAEVTYGSGVDLERFQITTPRADNSKCTFLFVGRILKDKGTLEFVEAIKAIRPSFPESKFQVAGKIDRDNPAHIDHAMVDGWSRSGLIEYLGEVDDVRSVMRGADVVVLPSYREGVPKALLEAMAMGKPLITTDVPGCRETVVPNVNGLLIAPRDVDALSQAMQYMITHPERRTEMGQESRRLAEQRFDVRKVNRMILKAMGLA